MTEIFWNCGFFLLPHGNSKGWRYFNDDTGSTWTTQHPVESGDAPDATGIIRMTLSEFLRQHPMDFK
jgi:hypothetical protein